MNSSERVAYLKGLLDGMNLNADDNQVKLIRAIVDTLGVMCEEFEMVAEETMELGETLDDLEEEVTTIARLLYEEVFGDEFEDDEDKMVEVECPVCGEEFYMDVLEAIAGDVECPECGAEIEVELDGEDDADDKS